MNTDITECERIGYADGLAAGLAHALTGVDIPATAPGPHVATPREWQMVPEHQTPLTTCPQVENGLAAAEGIALVSVGGDGPTDPELLGVVGVRLAAVRLGLVHRLTDQAIAHLSERTAAGEPLIRKQLVTGSLADVITALETLRRHLRTLGERPHPLVLLDIHDQLTELGWRVAMFFGASGYIADHATRGLYVSALVANTWTATTWTATTAEPVGAGTRTGAA